jgi:hypothetical protein
MKPKSYVLTRRMMIALLASTGIAVSGVKARAAEQRAIIVHKDPNCSCCSGWIRHMTAAGFSVTVVNATDLNAVKVRLGVPNDLASCHTAEIGGYVIEGHVPAPVIVRLLAEKSAAKGLAVPGMPVGSPGMEGWPLETYDVILFGGDRQRTYARYRGSKQI